MLISGHNGTKIILPVLRKLKVVLKCKNGAKSNSMVYVVWGAEGVVLGREGEMFKYIFFSSKIPDLY